MTGPSLIPQNSFFENYSEAVIITDATGKVLLLNKAGEALTSLNADEIQALISELMETLMARVSVGVQNFEPLPKPNASNMPITGTGKDENGLISFIKKDGTVILLQISISSITLTDQSTGTVYTLHDHSEIQQVKEQAAELAKKLERAIEETEQLAYVASHDLQEPLRTITSYIQLIKRSIEKGNTAALDEFMKFVIDGAARMQGLISDLLQFSRVTKKGSSFTEVDMNEVVKVALAQLKDKIEATKARISVDELPKIQGDMLQLVRLVQNVVDNALKFKSPEREPELKISVQDKKDHYLFGFNDNGIGIDEKFYNRIFVIFQRLHLRGEYEGTGVGLAVTKKIVERHGGEMWVQSEIGKGSTFYITLKKQVNQ